MVIMVVEIPAAALAVVVEAKCKGHLVQTFYSLKEKSCAMALIVAQHFKNL